MTPLGLAIVTGNRRMSKQAFVYRSGMRMYSGHSGKKNALALPFVVTFVPITDEKICRRDYDGLHGALKRNIRVRMFTRVRDPPVIKLWLPRMSGCQGALLLDLTPARHSVV